MHFPEQVGYRSRTYVDATHVDVSLFIDRYSQLVLSISREFLPLCTYSRRVGDTVPFHCVFAVGGTPVPIICMDHPTEV